jgi:hypothetical protein
MRRHASGIGCGARGQETNAPRRGSLRLALGSKDKAAHKGPTSKEPKAGRNGASESAAWRCNDVAMARREAPHLRKKV